MPERLHTHRRMVFSTFSESSGVGPKINPKKRLRKPRFNHSKVMLIHVDFPKSKNYCPSLLSLAVVVARQAHCNCNC